MIDVGLLHHLQELARIGAERLDVTPLPLGIDGVEGEARLARAAEAGDHRQRLARDIDVDILEIVLARAADGEVSQHEAVRSSYVLLVSKPRAGVNAPRQMGPRTGGGKARNPRTVRNERAWRRRPRV